MFLHARPAGVDLLVRPAADSKVPHPACHAASPGDARIALHSTVGGGRVAGIWITIRRPIPPLTRPAARQAVPWSRQGSWRLREPEPGWRTLGLSGEPAKARRIWYAAVHVPYNLDR